MCTANGDGMSTDQIITLVFNKKALWNASHPDHRNRYVLDKLWKKVANECEITDKLAQRKWKNLRDYFRKEFKKIPLDRSGYAGDVSIKSHWPYFKSLLFLKDQFTPRTSSSNLHEPGDENCEVKLGQQSKLDVASEEGLESTDESLKCEDEDSNFSASQPSVTTSTFTPSITPSTTPSTSTNMEPRTLLKSHMKRKLNHADVLVDMEQEKLDFAKEKAEQRKEETVDDHQSFFDSLLPHVRKIREEDILLFRNEVQNVVHDYAYGRNRDKRNYEQVL